MYVVRLFILTSFYKNRFTVALVCGGGDSKKGKPAPFDFYDALWFLWWLPYFKGWWVIKSEML